MFLETKPIERMTGRLDDGTVFLINKTGGKQRPYSTKEALERLACLEDLYFDKMERRLVQRER